MYRLNYKVISESLSKKVSGVGNYGVVLLVNAIEVIVVFCFHKLFCHLTSIVNQFLQCVISE